MSSSHSERQRKAWVQVTCSDDQQWVQVVNGRVRGLCEQDGSSCTPCIEWGD